MNRHFLFAISILAFIFSGCSKSQWKTYSSEEFGFSIDSPYPLEFETREVFNDDGSRLNVLDSATTAEPPSNFLSFLKTFEQLPKHQRPVPPDLPSFFVSSTKGIDKGRVSMHGSKYDPEKMAERRVKILKSLGNKYFQNSKYKIERTSCSGLKAALLTIENETYHDGKFLCKNHEEHLFVAQTSQYWIFSWELTSFRNKGEVDFEHITNRMISSIKIKN
ncbi:MAG TPA: hypothetical protein VHE12_02105 [bacterium]|nr:hypothetical protein [bacterium]